MELKHKYYHAEPTLQYADYVRYAESKNQDIQVPAEEVEEHEAIYWMINTGQPVGGFKQ